MSMPEAGFTQSEADVCMYFLAKLDVVLIHHVDDGRIGGPMSPLSLIVQYMRTYILLEVSDAIIPGDAVEFLKPTKSRTELGCVMLPNKALRLRILEGLGYTEEKARTLRAVATPGVKRVFTDEDMQKDVRPDTLFMSIGGCSMYLSSDMPSILYAGK